MKRVLALCSFIILVAAILLPAYSAEVYMWVDEKGGKHITDQPPEKPAKMIGKDTLKPDSPEEIRRYQEEQKEYQREQNAERRYNREQEVKERVIERMIERPSESAKETCKNKCEIKSSICEQGCSYEKGYTKQICMNTCARSLDSCTNRCYK